LKIAVLCDTHAGVRNDSGVFLDNAKKFYHNILFPTMESRGITKILHLGDILDRRKYINFVTASRLRTDFMEPLREKGLSIDHILGNHDVYYKDTNAISGVYELFGNSTFPITIIDKVGERDYGGLPILCVPWITEDNQADTIRTIKSSRAKVCFGHLELTGFEMSRGNIMKHGIDSELFEQFEVGQYDWGDNEDSRGFHIFDTETLQFEHVGNPYEMFHKIEYDDEEETTGLLNIPEWIKGTYVKVIVKRKTDPILFDKFIQAIEEVGVADLQIEEEYINVEISKALELTAQSEDTNEIIRDYINHIETGVDRDSLLRLMENTYREATMNFR
jgi:hypothetical protein